MNLYTLYATPNSPRADFVMVAPLDVIKSYLLCKSEVISMVAVQCDAVGEAQVNLLEDRDGRIGYWRVKKGAELPEEEELDLDDIRDSDPHESY